MKYTLYIVFFLTCFSLLGQNVGVGTSTPNAKLEVQGDMRISNGTNDFVNWGLPNTQQTSNYILPPNTGQNGQVLETNGLGVLNWANIASNFTHSQGFLSNGIFTVPAGVTLIMVEAWAGGGGGGCQWNNGASVYGVGSGGGGGGYTMGVFNVAQGAVYSITVGGGGTGCTYDNSNNMTPSTAGGNSSFGGLLTAYGGAGGASSVSIPQYTQGGTGIGIGVSIWQGGHGNSGLWSPNGNSGFINIDYIGKGGKGGGINGGEGGLGAALDGGSYYLGGTPGGLPGGGGGGAAIHWSSQGFIFGRFINAKNGAQGMVVVWW